ncbi:DnaT-like ssDNA-binding domain-containing protein [Metapseudomonas otitidis]|uniref:DnaT-like ssDNA-binding domain-containing protein n=1 Tax=Metapseudomonas otitidis TaxID=319939 RepID=UPI0013F5A1EE|nr:DnaT-like ssDNA-binding domain-containing protein [Pseudomonas otitidis]
MPSFQINDAEWGALYDEPHHLFKVYCAIRMHMDYGTGIAGVERRLSEQMLRELLSIPASPGRPAHTATRKEVRYALDSLARLGLVDPVPTIGPFVFSLPQASRDTSVPERWGRISVRGGAIPGAAGGANHETPEASNPEGCSDGWVAGGAIGGAGGLSEVGPEVGPTSGLPPYLPPSSSNAREDLEQAASRQRFAMHDGWEPTPRGWGATCVRNGIPPTALDAGVLLEFRSYWIQRPDKFQSQGQWEHELAQRVKRTIRHNESRTGGNHAQRHANPAGGPRATGQQDHPLGSLRDELCDTSWAERLNIPHD